MHHLNALGAFETVAGFEPAFSTPFTFNWFEARDGYTAIRAECGNQTPSSGWKPDTLSLSYILRSGAIGNRNLRQSGCKPNPLMPQLNPIAVRGRFELQPLA